MEVLRTGDIVEIKGAYFKNDNGLWLVRFSPGDPGWSGGDYGLRRLCKNGKLSQGSNIVGFWPLMITVNAMAKKAEAKAWNERNATIRVRTDIDRKYIAEYFKEEAEMAYEEAEYFGESYGKDLHITTKRKEVAEFLSKVAERLNKEREE